MKAKLVTWMLARCVGVLLVGTYTMAQVPEAQDRNDMYSEQQAEVHAGHSLSLTAGQEAPLHGRERSIVTEMLEERIGTLSLHGGVIGYYQGRNSVKIRDERARSENGAGFTADLQIAFSPVKDGSVFARIHAGEGTGADRSLNVFANVNPLADDNPDGDGLRVLEVFYTQSFFEEKVRLSIGKTEPFLFIDENAFANDECTQFVGKPFVNNPVFDTEDEYGPLVALSAVPAEGWSLSLVYQSSSWPNADPENGKSGFDRIFDKPFFAGELTYSPSFEDLQGNYRIYGWTQTYPHQKIFGDGTEKGWGIGVSFDQLVHPQVGLFARAGYQNKHVYGVPWFWSAGTEIKGLVPSRSGDRVGFGVAGLKAHEDLEEHGTEVHLEAYYKLAFGDHFSVSSHLQYVIDPLGDSANENVFAGMLRLGACF